jgi:hypothetical protein
MTILIFIVVCQKHLLSKRFTSSSLQIALFILVTHRAIAEYLVFNLNILFACRFCHLLLIPKMLLIFNVFCEL